MQNNLKVRTVNTKLSVYNYSYVEVYSRVLLFQIMHEWYNLLVRMRCIS